jgi:branched-chain amino acid transport system substrate-binding protein
MTNMHERDLRITGARASRRSIVKGITAGSLALLAGCTVIPKGGIAPAPEPTEKAPDANILPTDAGRHRVALLVPMSGASGTVGQSIANAATMALLDTNAANLRITTYDTAGGAALAASKAIADGNKLILGPLLSEDVVMVANAARAAKVPMISYSNDSAIASRDVFVMGQAPGQSIARVLGFAKASGVNSVAAIIPVGDYGQRANSGLALAAEAQGVTVTAVETYDRGNTSVASAVRRAKDKGKFDALLIADGSRIALQAATAAGKIQRFACVLYPRSRCSKGWSPSAAAPACISAAPTSARCTTSPPKCSTTRWTRRWPAMPTGSRCDAGGRQPPDHRRQRPRHSGGRTSQVPRQVERSR